MIALVYLLLKTKLKTNYLKINLFFFNTLNSFIKNKYITFDDNLIDMVKFNSNLFAL